MPAVDLQVLVRIPTLAVLGNHYFEFVGEDQVVDVVQDAGVTLLDRTAAEIEGVVFARVPGVGW